MNLMIRMIFMIPALVFHGIFVASQSLCLKNNGIRKNNSQVHFAWHSSSGVIV